MTLDDHRHPGSERAPVACRRIHGPASHFTRSLWYRGARGTVFGRCSRTTRADRAGDERRRPLHCGGPIRPTQPCSRDRRVPRPIPTRRASEGRSSERASQPPTPPDNKLGTIVKSSRSYIYRFVPRPAKNGASLSIWRLRRRGEQPRSVNVKSGRRSVLQSGAAGPEHGKMALLPLEKAP